MNEHQYKPRTKWAVVITLFISLVVFPTNGCTTFTIGQTLRATTNSTVRDMVSSTVQVKTSSLRTIGSAVIIQHTKGEPILAITAKHVVDDLGDEFYITTQDSGYTKYIRMHVYKRDPDHDLALIISNEFAKEDSYFAQLAERPPLIGDTLYVVGSPSGIKTNVSRGILSSIIFLPSEGYMVYRTDADIYYGNSGGPVFNEDGEIVAIAMAVGVMGYMQDGEPVVTGIIPGSGLLVPLAYISNFIYNK